MTGGRCSSVLERGRGVWPPLSHDGVEGVVVGSSPPVDVGEYMPKRVEEVRLRTERVLLNSFSFSSSGLAVLEESLASREGVGGVLGNEDSFDFDSSSKGRRGRGRSRWALLEELAAIIRRFELKESEVLLCFLGSFQIPG